MSSLRVIKILTRSSAVAVIAGCTAYDVRHSWIKLLSYLANKLIELIGIAMVSMSISCLQFRSEVCFWCRKSAVDAR